MLRKKLLKLIYLSMCVSVFFIFICFVVVLVGRACLGEGLGAARRESYSQLVVGSGNSLLVFHVVDEGLAKGAPQ